MGAHREAGRGSWTGREAQRLARGVVALTLVGVIWCISGRPAAGGGRAERHVFVVGAAGDVAGDHLPGRNRHRGRFDDVADLALSLGLDRFLMLGDGQHNFGELEDYLAFYDPVFGRLNDIVAPVTGNHDYYRSTAAEGYFAYFGALARPPLGYYSFDLGGWHLIALNSQLFHPQLDSNASWGGIYFGPGTPEYEAQMTWLRDDLARTRSTRIIAFWHHTPTS